MQAASAPASPPASSSAAFRPARAFGKSLAICARHFVAFYLASLVVYLPAIVGVALLATGVLRFSPAATLIIAALLCLVFGQLAAGTIAPEVFLEADGGRTSAARVLTRGLLRLPALFGVTFLLTAIVAVVATALFFLVGLLAALLSLSSHLLGLLAFVPLVAAPLVGLFACFWVAIPAAVLEHAAPLAALRRSSELTEGARGPISALLLVLFGAGFLLHWIWVDIAPLGPRLAMVTLMLLVTVAISTLASTASAVTYHDLRRLEEEADRAARAT
jgi:hypothetical protein